MIGRELTAHYKRFMAQVQVALELPTIRMGVVLAPMYGGMIGVHFGLQFIFVHVYFTLYWAFIEKPKPGEERCPNCDSKNLAKVMNRREVDDRWLHYRNHSCRACGEVTFTAEDLSWNAEQLRQHEREVAWDRRWASLRKFFGRA